MAGAFIYQVFYDKTDYPTLDIFLKTSIWGTELWFSIAVMFGIAAVCLLPLYLLRDISKLRFSTVLGIICLAVVTLAICIQLPQFIIQNNEDPSIVINWYDASAAFDTENFYFFRGTATIFFAFSCHFGVFPVYEKLANNNKRRTRKFIYRSVVLDSAFFILVGICGYLTQPVNTPPLVVNRNSLKGDESDILMTICRLLIFVLLCVKLPVIYNTMRISIFNLIWKTTEISSSR